MVRVETTNRWLNWIALLCVGAMSAIGVWAATPKVVDGVAIYLAVVPAEIVLGHPRQGIDPDMHGDVPLGKDWYHVMVAVFDNQTGKRISGVEVTLSTLGPDNSGARKKLEAMTLGTTITYGNYFRLATPGIYKMKVEVRQSGGGAVEAEFEYLVRGQT